MSLDWEKYIDPKYCYSAYVTKVFDGDTITCDIDVGFDIRLRDQKIRLFGINTAEVKGDSKEQGLIARDFLRSKILNKEILLYTIKDKKGKYGRLLGIIYYNNEIINKVIVDSGYSDIALY